MAADLFETYAVTLVATMLLGDWSWRLGRASHPVSAAARRHFHRLFDRRDFFRLDPRGGKIMNALYKGVIVSAGISAIAFYFVC